MANVESVGKIGSGATTTRKEKEKAAKKKADSPQSTQFVKHGMEMRIKHRSGTQKAKGPVKNSN